MLLSHSPEVRNVIIALIELCGISLLLVCELRGMLHFQSPDVRSVVRDLTLALQLKIFVRLTFICQSSLRSIMLFLSDIVGSFRLCYMKICSLQLIINRDVLSLLGLQFFLDALSIPEIRQIVFVDLLVYL